MSYNWPLKKISNVATFLNNRRVPLKGLERAKRQGNYPYYGASGVVDYIDDFIFDGTYLLISEDGENLRSRKTPIAFQAHGQFWVNNHAHILKEKEEGILDYLEYYFSRLDLSPYITGAAQPKLNKANLERIEIPIPPINERMKIVRMLNGLTKGIDCNNHINQLLEESAQALFKSWFVDFDPVKAKIASLKAGGTKEDALHAAMSAISGKSSEELQTFRAESPDDHAELKNTAGLFPSAMEDGVPARWAKSEIGKEVKVVGGGTPSTKNTDYWDNGNIHWTTPKDLSSIDERVLTDTSRKITKKGLSKISSGLLPVGTVLLSSRAPVGYLALAKVPVAINQGYIAMQCLQKLPPEYVLQWCHANMDEIKQRSSGTTFAEISKRNFKLIEVIVPSAELLERYAKSTSQLYDFITANVIQNKALEETRDCLLPKLLSGAIQLNGE